VADRAAGPVPAAPAPPWRGIDELARLVGAWCWTEQRVFEIAGAWGSTVRTGEGAGEHPGAGTPSLTVWCAAAARRHGDLARAWADHLPVRAGVDQAALVAPPGAALAADLDTLGALPVGLEGFAVLVEAVLPGLRRVYADHLASASPVSEGPIIELLVGAGRVLEDEIADAGRLLADQRAGGHRDGPAGRALAAAFERSLGPGGVFPAVRPS